MKLTPSQSIIASDKHRFRVVNCGRRFGKTTLAVLEMIGKAVYGDERYICYLAPTFQSARDIAWQELKKQCQPITVKINESRLEITVRTVYGGTSYIALRGWEAVETLRGQKFHFIVVDEIAMLRNWMSNWQEVLRPTLTDYKGEALFISTPKGFNHFYDIYNLESKDADYKSFHFTTYNNPFIPHDEIEKAKKELTEDRFAQEYLADFRKTEGLIYKEFDRLKHVYTDKTYNVVERLLGVDFGWTNPSAVVTIEKDTDNNYYVVREWYHEHKTTEDIADWILTQNAHSVFPDPAEPDRIDILRRKGVTNIRDTSKDVLAGIDAVRELFKQNRLYIHSSCTNLIEELESYHYKRDKPDVNAQEEPEKDFDHAVDALKYCLFNSVKKDKGNKAHQFYPQYNRT